MMSPVSTPGVLSSDVGYLVHAIRQELCLNGVDDAAALISASPRSRLFRRPDGRAYDQWYLSSATRVFRGADMTTYVEKELQSMRRPVCARWAWGDIELSETPRN